MFASNGKVLSYVQVQVKVASLICLWSHRGELYGQLSEAWRRHYTGVAALPLGRRLCGAQGGSVRVRKREDILLPPGFESRTVRPIACRSTDCDVSASTLFMSLDKMTSYWLGHQYLLSSEVR
jgi:hypothetical protein